jgi:hypothetical protein
MEDFMKSIFFLSLLIACSGNEVSKEETPKKEQPTAFKIDEKSLEAAVNKAELVPSPVEMQKKLAEAGLQTELSTLVPTEKNINVVVEDNDQTAIRTGVVLADLVLTVKVSNKEQILNRLGKLKKGFAKLGAGDDIKATIEDFETRVSANEIKKSELLSEFDDMASVMVPELEYEAGDWIVPLIQAGTWLEGANLVSKAMLKEGKFDSANTFFREKEIVEYFISYVDRDGKDKAPSGVIKTLSQMLTEFKNIASKPRIVEADVKEIEKLTSKVLNLL